MSIESFVFQQKRNYIFCHKDFFYLIHTVCGCTIMTTAETDSEGRRDSVESLINTTACSQTDKDKLLAEQGIGFGLQGWLSKNRIDKTNVLAQMTSHRAKYSSSMQSIQHHTEHKMHR